MDSSNLSKCQMMSADSIVLTGDICLFQISFPGDLHVLRHQADAHMKFLLPKDVAIHRQEIVPGGCSEVIFTDMAHYYGQNLDHPQHVHASGCRQMRYIWQLKKIPGSKFYQCLTLGTFSKPETCKNRLGGPAKIWQPWISVSQSWGLELSTEPTGGLRSFDIKVNSFPAAESMYTFRSYICI